MKVRHFYTVAILLPLLLVTVSCGCNKSAGGAEEVVELQMPGNPFITGLYLADHFPK